MVFQVLCFTYLDIIPLASLHTRVTVSFSVTCGNSWTILFHEFLKYSFLLTCHVKILEAGDNAKPISMVMVWLLFNKSFWILNNSWMARWNAISSLWVLESQDSVLAGKSRKWEIPSEMNIAPSISNWFWNTQGLNSPWIHSQREEGCGVTTK